MNLLLNLELKKAKKLFNDWKIEEANEILACLYKKHPFNTTVLLQYAVVLNSLGYKLRALDLLEEILKLDLNNEDANSIYPTMLLAIADSFEDEGKLSELKEKFLVLTSKGFEKIGFDIVSCYIFLAQIEKEAHNYDKAIQYLQQAKNICESDCFYNSTLQKIEEMINEITIL